MIRYAAAVAVSLLIPFAPPALADDVASSPPASKVTPDGWQLTVGASDENETKVQPLTHTFFSREFDVSGTFVASVTGNGTVPLTNEVLEVGYQVGCNHTFGEVDAGGSTTLGGTVPTPGGALSFKISPGQVIAAPVDKKVFKGGEARISVTDVQVKVDGCIGGAYIRSYANLTSSTDVSDDVISYLGQTTKD